jgi:gag-polypeptide of LTR copia-type
MPKDDACLAWKSIVAKFEPITCANLIKKKQEFAETRLLSGQDPDQWIQNLELVQRRLQILGRTMSDIDCMIHILYNLPNAYKTTLELLENDLENKVTSLDQSDLFRSK